MKIRIYSHILPPHGMTLPMVRSLMWRPLTRLHTINSSRAYSTRLQIVIAETQCHRRHAVIISQLYQFEAVA